MPPFLSYYIDSFASMEQKPERSRTAFCAHHRQGISLFADFETRIDFEKTCGTDRFCNSVPKNPSLATWIFSFVPQGTASSVFAQTDMPSL